MISENRGGYAFGDGLFGSVSQPISPEVLDQIRFDAEEKLVELINNPLSETLEDGAFRGRRSINMALATNITYLTSMIDPAIRRMLEVQGGSISWLDQDPKFKSGLIRYSVQGLEYIDPDKRERYFLEDEPQMEVGIFFWTPQDGLNVKAVEDAMMIEDPTIVGFSQEVLSNLVGRATNLINHGGHSTAFTESWYLLRNPQPSKVPPISL